MRVADYMTDVVLFVAPDEGVRSAFEAMREANLHHLPVIDAEGVMRGVVSDRDLRRPRWADADEAEGVPYVLDDALTVADVMTPHTRTARPDTSLVEAARTLIEFRFGALPVVDTAGDLVGMLTPIDVMWAFIDLAAPGEGR